MSSVNTAPSASAPLSPLLLPRGRSGGGGGISGPPGPPHQGTQNALGKLIFLPRVNGRRLESQGPLRLQSRAGGKDSVTSREKTIGFTPHPPSGSCLQSAPPPPPPPTPRPHHHLGEGWSCRRRSSPAGGRSEATGCEGGGSASYRESRQIYGASGVAGCYSASDFLILWSPQPPASSPRRPLCRTMRNL